MEGLNYSDLSANGVNHSIAFSKNVMQLVVKMQKARDIINEMEMESTKKKLFRAYADRFDEDLKENLTLDYYDLAEKYEGTDPDVWEEFLDLPEISRYRMAKIGKLQEFAAFKALRMLEDKALLDNAGAISALKEILEKSKLIQQATRRHQQIILTYVPPKEGVKSDVQSLSNG